MSPDAIRPGLRERKKAKTRAAIQRHALRLFRDRGYDATTVAEIADAAEISPSTFFRYFPSKEEVVLFDAFDPVIFSEFASQPSSLGPVAALRRALRAAYGEQSPEVLAEQRERANLVLAVPELRSRALEQIAPATREFARLVAKRTGRPDDDIAILTFAGAVIGGIMTACFEASLDANMDLFELMDASLAYLERNLTLSA